MYLVHVAQDAVSAESGMKIAPTGLVNTIELGISQSPNDKTIEN